MGSCKFGNVKCTYSHSKDFLGKDGWWATEEGRQTRRDEVKNAGEVEKELRTLWNGLLCLPRTTSQMNGGKPGSSKGRAAIGRNKESIQSPITTTQPVVLLLSLGYADTFNSVHEHFLAALHSRADVIQAETRQSALQSLARSDITGVFVTDPEITEKKYAKLISKLVEYAKAGGTVVVGGSFSTFVRPRDNDAFFKKAWGQNWKMGSYHRTTFFLNPSRPSRLLVGPRLPASYSMKTVHLKDVAPESVVYGPTAESRTQSMVFPASSVDLDEAPVVYTQVGQGFLGYIGDVNGESESTNVILAMLGLLDEGTDYGRHRNSGSRREGKRAMHRGRHREWNMGSDSENEERMLNGGFTHDELNELLCQGIKPWDEW